MSKHVFLVFTSPVEGRETEYNDWYNQIHFPEVLAVEGFTGATRFSVSDAQLGGAPPSRYLAIYEIESDDPGGVLQRLRDALPQMSVSEALDRGSVTSYVYTAITERFVAPR